MVAISTSTEIDRPAVDVFAYITDPSRFAEWQQGVVAGRMEGSEPHTVGDACVMTRPLWRRSMCGRLHSRALRTGSRHRGEWLAERAAMR